MGIVELTLAVVLSLWAMLLCAYWRELRRCWVEPVLRVPVLIVESDDWGPGPPLHAAALHAITAVLTKHRDTAGRPPVMTLGVVLAVPDGSGLRPDGTYRTLRLDEPSAAPVLEAMRAGERAGVFALQLHGLEHAWPPTLRAVAKEEIVHQWLSAGELPQTERLPSHLQSRWTDARSLPSRDLPGTVIESAVSEEVEAYRQVFGENPMVWVPPTFVWSQPVERAMAEAGVRYLVTPGRRYDGRDAEGRPRAVGEIIRNGQRSPHGPVYLVRDIYFEPVRGHTARQVLAQVQRQVRLGRPALLETHRINFTGSEADRVRGLRELDALFTFAALTLPDRRYLSTEELGAAYAVQDRPYFEHRLAHRAAIWLRRLAQIPRLRKLAWLSGLMLPALLLGRMLPGSNAVSASS